jgi:hypothetical protein
VSYAGLGEVVHCVLNKALAYASLSVLPFYHNVSDPSNTLAIAGCGGEPDASASFRCYEATVSVEPEYPTKVSCRDAPTFQIG